MDRNGKLVTTTTTTDKKKKKNMSESKIEKVKGGGGGGGVEEGVDGRREGEEPAGVNKKEKALEKQKSKEKIVVAVSPLKTEENQAFGGITEEDL